MISCGPVEQPKEWMKGLVRGSNDNTLISFTAAAAAPLFKER